MFDAHWVEVGLLVLSYVVLVTMYITTNRSQSKILGDRLGDKLETVDATLEDFKREMRKLQDIIIQQAVQTERLDNMDQKLTMTFQIMDQRVLQQGKRVDLLEKRVFKLPAETWAPEG